MPDIFRHQYDKLEKEMIIFLGGLGVEAFNAAAVTNKCLQFCNGAVYTEDGEYAEIHKLKLEALESVIEEASGAPVLVAYNFKSDLERLQKHFKQGEVLDKKGEIIKKWNAGEVPLLFIHPASAGHGLNLQFGGNIIAWFGLTWNLENYEQAIARLHRQGQKQTVFNYHIMVEDSIDELVLKRLKSKARIQDILLNNLIQPEAQEERVNND